MTKDENVWQAWTKTHVLSKSGLAVDLWMSPAVVLFWLCRFWLMADRDEMQEDPLGFAFGDKSL